MNYTVEWLVQAEDDLTRIWMHYRAESKAINDAARRIEAELRRDAHRKGIPVDNYRCYIDRPLKVLFVAIPDDNQVRIAEVSWVGL